MIRKYYIETVKFIVIILAAIGGILALGFGVSDDWIVWKYLGLESRIIKIGIIGAIALAYVLTEGYLKEKEGRMEKFLEIVALVFGVVLIGWLSGVMAGFVSAMTGPMTEDMYYERAFIAWLFIYTLGLFGFIRWYLKRKSS